MKKGYCIFAITFLVYTPDLQEIYDPLLFASDYLYIYLR
jgi:hypothetical protein